MDINYYRQFEPIFGVWHITRLIGEGSFGKVFELEREDFGTTYKAALKAITVPASQAEVMELAAEGTDARTYYGTFVQDLVKEFALMSKLKGNSNIVSYENHQVIEHEDKVSWDILIQMELLTPLNVYLQSHPPTQWDIIKLGRDMCKALELCQKFRIIHRDVKPENIFVSDSGNFKLGDFGIARTVEKTTGGFSKKGTYNYMAPEVYKGEPYNSTVDIYSLGIVLYRMLNDNRTPFLPPYPAPITHSNREYALANRFSGALLPPPSHGEGRLLEIVMKACAYNPRDRYQTPTQMKEELEAVLYNRSGAGTVIPQQDVEPAKRAAQPQRRNPENVPLGEGTMSLVRKPHQEPQFETVREDDAEWDQTIGKETDPVPRDKNRSRGPSPSAVPASGRNSPLPAPQPEKKKSSSPMPFWARALLLGGVGGAACLVTVLAMMFWLPSRRSASRSASSKTETESTRKRETEEETEEKKETESAEDFNSHSPDTPPEIPAFLQREELIEQGGFQYTSSLYWPISESVYQQLEPVISAGRDQNLDLLEKAVMTFMSSDLGPFLAEIGGGDQTGTWFWTQWDNDLIFVQLKKNPNTVNQWTVVLEYRPEEGNGFVASHLYNVYGLEETLHFLTFPTKGYLGNGAAVYQYMEEDDNGTYEARQIMAMLVDDQLDDLCVAQSRQADSQGNVTEEKTLYCEFDKGTPVARWTDDSGVAHTVQTEGSSGIAYHDQLSVDETYCLYYLAELY